ncbi:MAG: hypothetical protein ACK5JT_07335 [Hyphomicrobiaceae bacterium]
MSNAMSGSSSTIATLAGGVAREGQGALEFTGVILESSARVAITMHGHAGTKGSMKAHVRDVAMTSGAHSGRWMALPG